MPIRTFAFLVLALVLAVSAVAVAQPPVERYLEELNRLADALETVDDEASARQAAQTVAEINAEMETLQPQFEAMEENERAAMLRTHAAAFQEVQTRIAMAMEPLADRPDLLEIISEELENMPFMR